MGRLSTALSTAAVSMDVKFHPLSPTTSMHMLTLNFLSERQDEWAKAVGDIISSRVGTVDWRSSADTAGKEGEQKPVSPGTVRCVGYQAGLFDSYCFCATTYSPDLTSSPVSLQILGCAGADAASMPGSGPTQPDLQ